MLAILGMDPTIGGVILVFLLTFTFKKSLEQFSAAVAKKFEREIEALASFTEFLVRSSARFLRKYGTKVVVLVSVAVLAGGGLTTVDLNEAEGNFTPLPVSAQREVIDFELTNTGEGGWYVYDDGSISNVGDAPFHGSVLGGGYDIIGLEAVDRSGYWIITKQKIFAFGNVPGFKTDQVDDDVESSLAVADEAGNPLGILLATTDGRVIPIGGAVFYGDASGEELASEIVDIEPTNRGYVLIEKSGARHAYGPDVEDVDDELSLITDLPSPSSVYASSTATTAADGSVDGLLLVTEDGAVVNLGNAKYFGDARSADLASPVVDIEFVEEDDGYILVERSGATHAYGGKATSIVTGWSFDQWRLFDETGYPPTESGELHAAPPSASSYADAGASVRSSGSQGTEIVSELVLLINQTRVEAGLDPVRVNTELTADASAWSMTMGTTGLLEHSDLEIELSRSAYPWTWMGENVLTGTPADLPTSSVVAEQIHNSFMLSDGHREAILDPDYEVIGIGVWIDETGSVWVTERFAGYKTSSLRAQQGLSNTDAPMRPSQSP